MTDETRPALRLAARIVLAMKSVGSVAKAGKNKDQGYAYQRAADIFEAAQTAFVEHGICLGATEGIIEWPDPLITKSGATMFVCRAQMVYHLEDIESGEEKRFISSGVGFDTSDKALNKAKTMAEKYFLKQLLLIGEEEDDADRDTPEETQQPACPVCGVVGSIIKGRPEFGGGWLCYLKKDGCGAKFATDPRRDRQRAQLDESSQQLIASDSPQPKRSRKPPKEETATNPAPGPEDGSESLLAATVGIPEADGDGPVAQEIRDLRDLLESVKFPGGWEKWSKVLDLTKPQERQKLRNSLEKRAKLIQEKKIEI